jgi:hypothetical protein
LTTANAVSAALRRCGFNPVSTRNREGIRVTGEPGRVRVVADLNSPGEAIDLATAARGALIDDGFDATPIDEGAAFYIERGSRWARNTGVRHNRVF